MSHTREAEITMKGSGNLDMLTTVGQTGLGDACVAPSPTSVEVQPRRPSLYSSQVQALEAKLDKFLPPKSLSSQPEAQGHPDRAIMEYLEARVRASLKGDAGDVGSMLDLAKDYVSPEEEAQREALAQRRAEAEAAAEAALAAAANQPKAKAKAKAKAKGKGKAKSKAKARAKG
eukprot:CAMPEP_0117538978 /NCGR_PEP_ID=MMETSP0784-20121206/42752_1 /TAXON_ID=39447 /ORGANISM="" /LENGTH=173 /DNA_ID=CAMNT_0005335599 /DNA_START=149 /DNA_END=670 /DNA_ORIENTATION=+